MSPSYWLETYGCQMNKAESESLKYQLAVRGWRPAQDSAEADLVVLNTCSVRQTAENRIWGRLGFFKSQKQQKSFKLALIGCMAERLKDEIFAQAPYVDILVGNFQKQAFLGYLDAFQEGQPGDLGQTEGLENPLGFDASAGAGQRQALTQTGAYAFNQRHAASGFQSYLPIMHGCNNFCSYCIVPYVRGAETSRSPDSIVQEIGDLEKNGIREITLLGQSVNAYRYAPSEVKEQPSLDFTGLLQRILPHLQKIEWIRFLSAHPKDFSAELIGLIAAQPRLCRHIHLPVQHGSNRVLERMGRLYTREQYLDLVERITAAIPEVALTTDLLIGFPGETEEDLELTLDLMRRIRFNDAYMYRYNPREGTRAFDLGDTVAEDDKTRRLERVIALQHQHSRERNQAKVGQTFQILVEAISKRDHRELLGKSEHNDRVVFSGDPDRIGHFTRVKVTSLSGHTLRGKEML